MNPKMLFLILAVVVAGGGFLAVRNLKTTVETDSGKGSTEVTSDDNEDSTANADGSARIGTLDSASNNSRKSLSQRPMRRGDGAAALRVTPVAGSSAASADGPAAPPTSEEIKEENRSIADLKNLFRSQTDSDSRIETADKLGLIDSPETIRTVLELLREEKDEAVQAALLEAMQGLDAQEEMADDIFKAVVEIYGKTTSEDVKTAAQDLMGDVGTQQAADGLQAAMKGLPNDSYLKINAAENLIRISQGNPDIVKPADAAALSEMLREQYKQAPDAGYRQQVLMALATDGKANVEFFREALQTEQDSQLKETLQRLVNMLSAPPPSAPPPGTVVTPVPTLEPVQ